MKKNKIELLAPAKSIEAMLVAYKAGANAVYAGGQKFSARAYATNFCEEEIIDAINISHLFGKKFYLAVNTVLKEEEIEKELYSYIYPLYIAGLDAVIVQDIGVFEFIRKNFRNLDIHISTQATVTDINGVKFFEENGASRVVVSREVELSNIKKISENSNLEIEAFIHGALCYCYSGQCYFSSMLGDRSANRGRCAQPCRLPYDVVDDATGKAINKDKIHPISLKDMCTINNIGDFINAGVTSFKIEGRMKSLEYVAGVTSIYRKYIDMYEKSYDVKVSDTDYQILQDLYNRGGFTKGYIHGVLGNMLTMSGSKRIDKSQEARKRYEDLCDNINKNIIDDELKKDVDIDIYVIESESIFMIARTDELEVSLYGKEVSKAINRPLTKDDITKCIGNLGNTYFRKRDLNIYISDNAFISVSEIKKLRREILDKLLLTYSNKRELEYGNIVNLVDRSSNKNLVGVGIQNRNQYNKVVSMEEVDRIFIDASMMDYNEICELIEFNNGKEIYISYPTIFDKRQCDWDFLQDNVSGFLVKNYEIWYHLKKNYKGKKLILNYNMHTHNSYANSFSYENGVDETFIPIESNLQEIKKVKNLGSNLYVYGYVPLMVTKQDLYKNMKVKDSTISLKDRYNIKFNVSKTNSNYNIIYNSVALSLIDKYKEINRNLNLYFDFTKEAPNEIEQILNSLIYGVELNKNFTRGHFKRGIK